MPPLAPRPRGGLAAVAAALAAACATPPAAAPVDGAPVHVKVIAINDFHGNLRPPAGGIRVADPDQPGRQTGVAAGGAPVLATMLNSLRAQNPNHVFVSAGDLVGASPLLSALFHDEPTVLAMNLMGLEASAMGNHELDQGPAELLRLQSGGCHPRDGCQGEPAYAGAHFRFLTANTVVKASGRTLLPPYFVKRFEGVPVAFVGVTLRGTAGIVVPSGTAGLEFGDEAASVNALVPELRRQGIEAIVVLLHEGGQPGGDYNECPQISGPVVEITKRLDRAVDLVISGHTHRAYNCVIDGRPVTSAGSYGTLLTQVDLTLDRRTHDVTAAHAENLIVRGDRYAPDAAVEALIAGYERRAAPLARRQVGTLAAPLPVRANDAGESALGQAVADSQLAATLEAGAQVAFMNPGGLRAPLGTPERLEVRYEDLFAVQPFRNSLVTMTLDATQLLQLLEGALAGGRPLHGSRGFGYAWDAALPPGHRVVPGSMRLHGRPVGAGDTVRVTVNSFMADGGDGLAVLRQGTDRRPGPLDVDAFERYLQSHPGLAPDPAPRLVRLN